MVPGAHPYHRLCISVGKFRFGGSCSLSSHLNLLSGEAGGRLVECRKTKGLNLRVDLSPTSPKKVIEVPVQIPKSVSLQYPNSAFQKRLNS